MRRHIGIWAVAVGVFLVAFGLGRIGSTEGGGLESVLAVVGAAATVVAGSWRATAVTVGPVRVGTVRRLGGQRVPVGSDPAARLRPTVARELTLGEVGVGLLVGLSSAASVELLGPFIVGIALAG